MPLLTMVPWESAGWRTFSQVTTAGCPMRDKNKGLVDFFIRMEFDLKIPDAICFAIFTEVEVILVFVTVYPG